jgi:hypothetical protein
MLTRFLLHNSIQAGQETDAACPGLATAKKMANQVNRLSAFSLMTSCSQ